MGVIDKIRKTRMMSPQDLPPMMTAASVKGAVSLGAVKSNSSSKAVEHQDAKKSLRDRVHAFMEGKYCQITMTLITLFALYGDDLRLYGFHKSADDGFYFLFFLSLLAFAWELTVNSVVQEDYKWSFFFWLDLIATASLVPDIKWIVDPLTELFESGETGGDSSMARAGRASRAGSRAGRIVRLVRLVRLLRVVNIAKLCSREQKTELDDIQQGKQKQEEQQKKVEASRLGKILSEQMTRRVIIGVLCMLFALPQMQVETTNKTPSYGLENLFWYGLSACYNATAFTSAGQMSRGVDLPCAVDGGRKPWISQEGWEFLAYEYSENSRYFEMSKAEFEVRPLLYMEVPDWRERGKIREIPYIRTKRCAANQKEPERYYKIPMDPEKPGMITFGEGLCKDAVADGDCCWEALHNCSPRRPEDDCPWRSSEIRDVSFTPKSCTEDPASPCYGAAIYARFLIREQTEMISAYSMLQTTFIVFLLGAGAMQFSNDTQTLVIAPIEKMVNIVKQLADDPLTKPDVEADGDDLEEYTVSGRKGKSSGQLETSMLENTILKIGGLLQVGFGEAGAQIIGKNMSSQEGELNIMIPGRKIVAIFGFCDIREFVEVTECLLEEVMVFVNKIARIVHTCVHEWGGAANKNIGDCFLLTWMVGDPEEQKKMLREGINASEKISELADKSLISFVKVIAEVRRASDLAAYSKHPKVIPKFGLDYRVNMGFGLHCGWAIEGAIGSEHKIDASYLSPHVNSCSRLVTATRQYGTDLLLSEDVHGILSGKAKDRCRKLDVVLVKGSAQAMGIYTFDVNEAVVTAPENHLVGQMVPPTEISHESLSAKGVDWMFVMDQDVVQLQEGISLEFHSTWRQAFHFYIAGDWPRASEMLERCNSLLPNGDGPSECLLHYLMEHDLQAPDEWAGCRKLETK